ncbi:hypothetical protein [Brevundimonas diminuta]|uniref:hypothetical protein n=1 Tax=Brevundimonas diminuta TaxID=293 RepID=UPI003208C701
MNRPLSERLNQGWELVSYSTTAPYGEQQQHCFLIRRQGQHRVLTVRKKVLGEGTVVSEMEV